MSLSFILKIFIHLRFSRMALIRVCTRKSLLSAWMFVMWDASSNTLLTGIFEISARILRLTFHTLCCFVEEKEDVGRRRDEMEGGDSRYWRIEKWKEKVEEVQRMEREVKAGNTVENEWREGILTRPQANDKILCEVWPRLKRKLRATQLWNFDDQPYSS